MFMNSLKLLKDDGDVHEQLEMTVLCYRTMVVFINSLNDNFMPHDDGGTHEKLLAALAFSQI